MASSSNPYDYIKYRKDDFEYITNLGNDALIKLGTPAIPFILDEIETGNTSLLAALQELAAIDTSTIKDYKECIPEENRVSYPR